MLIEWTLFRCCMWIVNTHLRDFRGSWWWAQLLLSVTAFGGLIFAVVFLGRLAWHSQWLDLAFAIGIAIVVMPLMTTIWQKTGESIYLLSPAAMAGAPVLAYLMW